MSKINVQTYSFSENGKEYNNEAVFRAAAEIGFDGVELFGPNFQMDPVELKKLLDELKLSVISLHVPGTDKVLEFIPFAKAVGSDFIGIGMEVLRNDEEVHKFAARLNEIGKTCKENGLTLTYHNHTQEFAPCGDKIIMDVLMDETNPEYVSFEVDAGWCAGAGYDPIEFVKKHSGRVKLIHLKESDRVIGPQPPMDFDALEKDENGQPVFTEQMKADFARNQELNCAAGDGIVDWKALKEVADAHGCVGYTVEREITPAGFESRYDVLKHDLEYYRTTFEA